MKRSKFNENQIIAILKAVEVRASASLCGFSNEIGFAFPAKANALAAIPTRQIKSSGKDVFVLFMSIPDEAVVCA